MRMIKLGILNKLNERLSFYDKQEDYDKATSEDIQDLINFSKIELPDDYVKFLGEVMGVAFVIDDYPTFEFLNVRDILQQDINYPFLKTKLPNILVIGTDLGDYLLFYGYGQEGFGIYACEAGSLSYENSTKISDTITDFIVDGVGFDRLCDLLA